MEFYVPKLADPEPYYAIDDQTGELCGPFDPGAVWFVDPPDFDRWHRDQLDRMADSLLEAAATNGREGLNIALARRFLGDRRGFPEHTGQAGFYWRMLHGISGGAISRGFLGDGTGGSFQGFQVDDSKNNTTITGYAGGAGGTVGTPQAVSGLGPGRGIGGDARGGGSGGGYGTASTAAIASGSGRAAAAGPSCGLGAWWEALLQNSYTQAILQPGGGGGGGGGGTVGGFSTGGAGGAAGGVHVETVLGTLTTVARTLTGTAGGSGMGGSGQQGSGGGGGGSGGFWLGIAYKIAQGSGTTIAVSGGAGGALVASFTTAGKAGGNGRVVQIYFDSSATLTVTGGVQHQYQDLAVTLARRRALPVVMTLLGVHFWDPQRTPGYPVPTLFVEHVYTHPSGAPDHGHWREMAGCCATLRDAGHQVLLKVKYRVGVDQPRSDDELNDYLHGLEALAPLFGGIGIAFGNEPNWRRSETDDPSVSPAWMARVFNGYSTDPGSPWNALQVWRTHAGGKCRYYLTPTGPFAPRGADVVTEGVERSPWAQWSAEFWRYCRETARVPWSRRFDGVALHAYSRVGTDGRANGGKLEPWRDPRESPRLALGH